jgi:hypothetical protein
MKKQVVAILTVAVLVCGITYGQDETSNYEHLKCYGQLIGTWEYKGPALETAEGIVEKGTEVLVRVTRRWILDKNAIGTAFYAKVEGGIEIEGRGLIGWDRAEKRIIGGGLGTLGGYSLGTTAYDPSTKTWTTKREGTGIKGEKTSSTVVLTVKDKDTYVLQAFDRVGGLFQGDGPKVTYKRAKRPKQPKRVKQAK